MNETWIWSALFFVLMLWAIRSAWSVRPQDFEIKRRTQAWLSKARGIRLFGGPPVIEEQAGIVRMRSSREMFVWGVILIVVAAVFIGAIVDFPLISVVPWFVFVVPAVVIWLWKSTSVAEIRWTLEGDILSVTWGWLPPPKTVEFKREKTVVRLIPVQAHYELVLEYRRQRVIVSRSCDSAELMPAFRKLGSIVEASDECLVKHRLPNGDIVSAATEIMTFPWGVTLPCLRTEQVSETHWTIVSNDPDSAEAIGGMLIYGGAVFLLLSAGTNDHTLMILFAAIGMASVPAGLWALIQAKAGLSLTIDVDEQSRELTVSRKTGSRKRTSRRLTQPEMACLQVCTGVRPGNETPAPFYQLNVVLREPRGERINIFSGDDLQLLKEMSNALSQLVGVPVVDSSPFSNTEAKI